MAVAGPRICRNTPWLVRFWKTLWSTSVSSPLTLTQFPPLVSWMSLRVKRLCASPAGTVSPPPCRSVNPRSTTYETPPANANPVEPLITALPTCSAVTVTGADAVPDRLIVNAELAVNVPSANAIVSPGLALFSAVCNAERDVTRIWAADAGGAKPASAASATVGRRRETRRIRLLQENRWSRRT